MIKGEFSTKMCLSRGRPHVRGRSTMNSPQFIEYRVWDLPVRLFHWVNFLSVFSLITVALIMMYKQELGITSTDAKVGLKTLHVIIGYVFVINLLVRLVWGFFANRYGRWGNILPGRGFGNLLRIYLASVRNGEPQQFLGHNPMGRLAVTVILLLMLVLMVSGLVRAGTDIYYPPFGVFAADFVAKNGTDSTALKPYDTTGTNAQRMAELKAFKGPFGKVHKYASYTLMAIILVHIFFVIRAETTEGGGIISAMFTGNKVTDKTPVDS